MKITLNESKEKISAEFITAFISRGWDEVGALQAEIAAIKKEFSETGQVEEILQELLDVYLIVIGKLQNYLEKKNLVSIPNQDSTNKLKEDININIDNLTITSDTTTPQIADKNTEEDAQDELLQLATKQAEDIFKDANSGVVAITPTKAGINNLTQAVTEEPFEYFCDFGEPDLSEPHLTDDDIYVKVNTD